MCLRPNPSFGTPGSAWLFLLLVDPFVYGEKQLVKGVWFQFGSLPFIQRRRRAVEIPKAERAGRYAIPLKISEGYNNSLMVCSLVQERLSTKKSEREESL